MNNWKHVPEYSFGCHVSCYQDRSCRTSSMLTQWSCYPIPKKRTSRDVFKVHAIGLKSKQPKRQNFLRSMWEKASQNARILSLSICHEWWVLSLIETKVGALWRHSTFALIRTQDGAAKFGFGSWAKSSQSGSPRSHWTIICFQESLSVSPF